MNGANLTLAELRNSRWDGGETHPIRRRREGFDAWPWPSTHEFELRRGWVSVFLVVLPDGFQVGGCSTQMSWWSLHNANHH